MAMITIPKSELLDMEKSIADLKNELVGQGFCLTSLDALIMNMRKVVDLQEGMIRFSHVLTIQATVLYLELGLELAKLREEAGIDSIEKNLTDSRSQQDKFTNEWEDFTRAKPTAAKILMERGNMRLSKDHAGVD